MARRSLHLAFTAALLATGCNSLFGIHEGNPRPICVAGDDVLEPMIDDMEDGTASSALRTGGADTGTLFRMARAPAN